MSLKGKINNYAKSNNITAQVVLQNFMFERFLERLSKSNYCDKFVVKGGILISALVGLDTRSTMDLDATLRQLALTEDTIIEAINAIGEVPIDDDVTFKTKSIAPIRNDDLYGGFCVKLEATYDTIVTPLSIDISTGDIITPAAVQHEISGIFDENLIIQLWGYNIETILAEKVETILSRGIFNTRPRDFYDVYILTTTQTYEKDVFQAALLATSKHRDSASIFVDTITILDRIESSNDLQESWDKYQKKFAYAKDISYEEVIGALRVLLIEN